MKCHLQQTIESLADKLEQFIDWTGRSVSWLVLLMVMVTFLVVVFRYVFDMGWIALQESISYFHSLVFLVGAAYTLKHNAHVRVDIIYDRLSDKSKAWVDLLGHIFPYVTDSWRVTEGSREAGGLPAVYLLKSAILVMAALLMIQGSALILRALLAVTQPPSPKAHEESFHDMSL